MRDKINKVKIRAQLPARRVEPTARREDPALVHPGFRLVEPKSLQLGERGDIRVYICQQCSGVRCQVSATEFDPLCRSNP